MRLAGAWGTLTATQVPLPSNTPTLPPQVIGRMEFKGGSFGMPTLHQALCLCAECTACDGLAAGAPSASSELVAKPLIKSLVERSDERRVRWFCAVERNGQP